MFLLGQARRVGERTEVRVVLDSERYFAEELDFCHRRRLEARPVFGAGTRERLVENGIQSQVPEVVFPGDDRAKLRSPAIAIVGFRQERQLEIHPQTPMWMPIRSGDELRAQL